MQSRQAPLTNSRQVAARPQRGAGAIGAVIPSPAVTSRPPAGNARERTSAVPVSVPRHHVDLGNVAADFRRHCFRPAATPRHDGSGLPWVAPTARCGLGHSEPVAVYLQQDERADPGRGFRDSLDHACLLDRPGRHEFDPSGRRAPGSPEDRHDPTSVAGEPVEPRSNVAEMPAPRGSALRRAWGERPTPVP